MVRQMKMIRLGALGVALLALPACQTVNDAIGLSKQSPDEFEVVRQRPLTIPPDFDLRPPEPGAPSLTDEVPMETARDALIGEAGTAATPSGGPSAAEQAVLAGSGEGNPNIRTEIETERRERVREEREEGWFSRWFNWFGDDETPDPVAAPEETATTSSEGDQQPAEPPVVEQPQGGN